MNLPDPGRRCAACGGAFPPGASFCAECGAPTAHQRQAAARGHLEARRTVRRALASVALVFAGTLALSGTVHILLGAFDERWRSLAGEGGLLFVGLLACLPLGYGGVRATLPLHASPAHLALGIAGGALAAGIAWLYVVVLRGLAPGAAEGGPDPAWLRALLLAGWTPAVEEWLCRGVLWAALDRLAGARAALVASAALFALLHGLNGAGWLELPHRFAAGLVFGWLRLRSGGLPAPVVAHAVLNGAAILM